MVDINRKMDEHQNWFQWITTKIPIYNGYQDREQRRAADAALRDYVVNNLEAKQTQANDVTSQMLLGPGLAQLEEMNKANTRLQTLIDKVKTASEGYAGFFAPIKINQEELDKLYEFDYGMLVQADDIGVAIEAIQATLDSGESEKLAPAVRGYVKMVTDASALFDKRKEILLDLM